MVWNQEVFKAVCEEKEAYKKWKVDKDDEFLKQQWKDKNKTRKKKVRNHKRKIKRYSNQNRKVKSF